MMAFSKNTYLKWFQYGILTGIAIGIIASSYTFYLYISKPDFNLQNLSLTDTRGNDFMLESRKGNPIVLNFLSRGCAPCIKELPILESAVTRYKDSIQFYFIMKEDKESIQSFQKKYPYKLDYLLSEKSFTDYGILGVPQTFFIDKKFKVIDSQEGSFDSVSLELKLRRMVGR
ncbi:MAG: TlpA family protein disulfide reductase [Chitinophagales bacterium]